MKTHRLAVAIGLAACVAAVSAATMKEIKLSEGYDEITRIAAPIYDGSRVN